MSADIITEKDLLHHQELAAITSERLAWEGAAHMVMEEASKHFKSGQDDFAALLRRIAVELGQKAKEASRKQDIILKERS